MNLQEKITIAEEAERCTNSIFLVLLDIMLDAPNRQLLIHTFGSTMKRKLYARMEGTYGDTMKRLFDQEDVEAIRVYHRDFVTRNASQIINQTFFMSGIPDFSLGGSELPIT